MQPKQESLNTHQKPSPLPNHVAIIMDGNGRWASQRGLSRLAGHRAGTDNIRKVVREFNRYGIKFLTLYAFSTENWGRPDEEVQGLMEILSECIDEEVAALHEEAVKVRHIGRIDRLDQKLQKSVNDAIELTKNNQGINLNVAFDYGGRDEILMAIKRIAAKGIPPEKIDEKLFSYFLYTSDLPDPDLIIRTAGEMRLSNFLLWQSAYSEYYCTTTPWPEFSRQEIHQALMAYCQRQRRFGVLNQRGSF